MTVYFAHATSFCAGVWRPVMERLAGVSTKAWDFAGHGSGPELRPPVDWAVFGNQVLEETEPGGIGVGHSMGATALLMAQIADQSRFRFLVLIEPIVFPGPYRRVGGEMSAIASRRRRSFASRSEARRNFAAKAFSTWDEAALDGYVSCGLVGDGPVDLACDPELEADIYMGSNAHDTWERLEQVEIPVLLLAGEGSDTIDEILARAQAARFPKAGLEIVPGAGHFLPMELPALVSDRVARLAALG